MKHAKHTPGPTYISIETIIQGSSEDPIVFKCRSEKQAMKLRSTIAAAPDMLEVLEAVHEVLVNKVDRDPNFYRDKLIKRLSSAIAKARGGSDV